MTHTRPVKNRRGNSIQRVCGPLLRWLVYTALLVTLARIEPCWGQWEKAGMASGVFAAMLTTDLWLRERRRDQIDRVPLWKLLLVGCGAATFLLPLFVFLLR